MGDHCSHGQCLSHSSICMSTCKIFSCLTMCIFMHLTFILCRGNLLGSLATKLSQSPNTIHFQTCRIPSHFHSLTKPFIILVALCKTIETTTHFSTNQKIQKAAFMAHITSVTYPYPYVCIIALTTTRMSKDLKVRNPPHIVFEV